MHSDLVVRYPFEVAGALDADHGLPPESERQRVGHCDYLHDPAVDQSLDPLAHRGLGPADYLADRWVGAAAVLLQLLDDLLGQVIEDDPDRAARAAPAAARVAIPLGSQTARDGGSPRRMSHAVPPSQGNRVMCPALVN